MGQLNTSELVERLRRERSRVLKHPQLLTLNDGPRFETVWAFAAALSFSIDELLGRDAGSWSGFLRDQGFGARTEARVALDDYDSLDDQLRFLSALYEAYDDWAGAPRQGPSSRAGALRVSGS